MSSNALCNSEIQERDFQALKPTEKRRGTGPDSKEDNVRYLFGPIIRERAAESARADSADVDRKLVKRTLAGDQRAFDLLFTKYQSRVSSVVSMYIKDFDTVKDVVQESFIRAYKALPNYRFESRFYTWIYRIAVNASLNHLKSNKSWMTRVGPLDDQIQDEQFAPQTEEPERTYHNEDLKRAIKRVVDRLPIELRTVLMLRETEGLNYEQIAQVVGCELGTVKSRISRARERVASKTEHLYQTEF